MGFNVQLLPDSVKVDLTGWDAVANLRRRIQMDVAQITHARVEWRADLEELIDHRALGVGTHLGNKRPDRRRVGTMMGRGVCGKQFWAVPATDGSCQLLVIDLSEESDYRRVVLAVDDPDGVAVAIEELRRA